MAVDQSQILLQFGVALTAGLTNRVEFFTFKHVKLMIGGTNSKFLILIYSPSLFKYWVLVRA